MLKFFKRLILVIVTTFVLVGGTAAAAYYLLPTAPTSTDAEAAGLNADDTYNILLCGVDEHHENADTIIIASFNAKDKSIKLLSIPRDTMSNEERSIQKINASYSVDHIGNIDQTIKEVEMLTGIPIDRYAITTFDGFKEAIDALGGVEMDVPQDLHYSDPYQDLEIDLKKGPQTLDGAHALQFVRYRSGYAEGDIGRIKAQQIFFKALSKTLLDSGNVTKIPALARVISNKMETDLTIPEMLWFAKEARGVNADNVKMFMLPGVAQYVDEISYYIPSEQGILELVNKEFLEKGHLIKAGDLNLVPMAKDAISEIDQNDTKPPALNESDDVDGSYYDTNKAYPNSRHGGSTYQGSTGAYVPPSEQNTGQSSRGSSTQTTPALPSVGGNATIVPATPDNSGSGNTAPAQ